MPLLEYTLRGGEVTPIKVGIHKEEKASPDHTGHSPEAQGCLGENRGRLRSYNVVGGMLYVLLWFPSIGGSHRPINDGV